jgi:hypothetical protein
VTTLTVADLQRLLDDHAPVPAQLTDGHFTTDGRTFTHGGTALLHTGTTCCRRRTGDPVVLTLTVGHGSPAPGPAPVPPGRGRPIRVCTDCFNKPARAEITDALTNLAFAAHILSRLAESLREVRAVLDTAAPPAVSTRAVSTSTAPTRAVSTSPAPTRTVPTPDRTATAEPATGTRVQLNPRADDAVLKDAVLKDVGVRLRNLRGLLLRSDPVHDPLWAMRFTDLIRDGAPAPLLTWLRAAITARNIEYTAVLDRYRALNRLPGLLTEADIHRDPDSVDHYLLVDANREPLNGWAPWIGELCTVAPVAVVLSPPDPIIADPRPVLIVPGDLAVHANYRTGLAMRNLGPVHPADTAATLDVFAELLRRHRHGPLSFPRTALTASRGITAPAGDSVAPDHTTPDQHPGR